MLLCRSESVNLCSYTKCSLNANVVHLMPGLVIRLLSEVQTAALLRSGE